MVVVVTPQWKSLAIFLLQQTSPLQYLHVYHFEYNNPLEGQIHFTKINFCTRSLKHFPRHIINISLHLDNGIIILNHLITLVISVYNVFRCKRNFTS